MGIRTDSLSSCFFEGTILRFLSLMGVEGGVGGKGLSLKVRSSSSLDWRASWTDSEALGRFEAATWKHTGLDSEADSERDFTFSVSEKASLGGSSWGGSGKGAGGVGLRKAASCAG